MNFVNSQNLQIGQCFKYTDQSGINRAFVLYNIEVEGLDNYVEFIVVDLSSCKLVKNIDDVIACGEVYVSSVYNHMSKSNNDGIFMFDFNQFRSELIAKWSLIGKINLDTQKFVLGGAAGPSDEEEIKIHFTLLNNGHEGYKKKLISNYLKK